MGAGPLFCVEGRCTTCLLCVDSRAYPIVWSCALASTNATSSIDPACVYGRVRIRPCGERVGGDTHTFLLAYKPSPDPISAGHASHPLRAGKPTAGPSLLPGSEHQTNAPATPSHWSSPRAAATAARCLLARPATPRSCLNRATQRHQACWPILEHLNTWARIGPAQDGPGPPLFRFSHSCGLRGAATHHQGAAVLASNPAQPAAWSGPSMYSCRGGAPMLAAC